MDHGGNKISMTNEYFILALKVMRIAVTEKDRDTVSQLIEHAQKLVAVVEAANKLADDNECKDYLWEMQDALEKLEKDS